MDHPIQHKCASLNKPPSVQAMTSARDPTSEGLSGWGMGFNALTAIVS